MGFTIGPLLLVVFESILEVFLVCIAGYVLSRKGILDKKTQKQLNRINVSIFTPSLLFSKVAFSLSPEKLKELWIIPLFFAITTAVSMIVAYVLGTLFRLKRSQRAFGMAAAMFMNSNSLPIALMQSLVVTVPGLKWGKDDTKSAMIGRALTYLVLHSTLGMVLRWSYGVRLLAQADDEVNPQDADVEAASPLISPSETGFPAAPAEEPVVHPSNFQGPTPEWAWPPPDPNQDPDANPIPPRRTYTGPPILVHTATNRSTSGRILRPSTTRRSTGVFHSFPNSPAHAATPLPAMLEVPEGGGSTSSFLTTPITPATPADDDELAGSAQRTVRPDARSRSLYKRIRRPVRNAWLAFCDFMTVPLWAALASLIVALVPALQHTLEVHIPPVKNAVTAAGQCSIPVTLIVLGAYFYTPPSKDEGNGEVRLDGPENDLAAGVNGHSNGNSEDNSALGRAKNRLSTVSLVGSVKSMLGLESMKNGQTRHRTLLEASEAKAQAGETKTVLVAVLSRMIITPLLLLPAIAMCAKFDWHAVFEDPVFVVSNVLLIASPPALTLAQITQAASGDAFERLISRTIFWSYCIITPPSTIIFVVIGLKLAEW